MTSVESQTYSGGAWSALTTVATYYYDANGARARTVEGSVTNNFVYQGIDTMCQFGSDGKTNKYVYAAGQLELRTCSASESYAYITDALGSTRFVLKNGIKDATNTVFSAVSYKPFGSVYSTTGSDRITYAGETIDSPTGLVYLSARYMDPSTGRFYALDPELGSLSSPQTLNRYVYCANSPLIHTDPTGRFLNLIAGAVGAVVGGVIGGVVAYVATGGDLQATGAAMLGGMVAGGLAGLTMGVSLIPTVGALGNAMAIGAVAGAAGGAVEKGLLAGARSNWDIGKMAEGAASGAIIGGATGFLGGAASTKLLNVMKIVPKGTGAYTNLVPRAESVLSNTAGYATKEGITEGVQRMPTTTAHSLAVAVTAGGLVTFGKTVNSIVVGPSVSAFTSWYYQGVQRAWRAG